MSLIRWSPMLSRWPDIWDDDLFPSMSNSANNLDVYETKDEVVIRANVAGVPADKVDITFEKGVLWIQAEAEQEKDDANRKYYSKSTRKYSYKVAVPGMIDYTQEPEARIENGEVIVTCKKAEASKPRKLTVKAK